MNLIRYFKSLKEIYKNSKEIIVQSKRGPSKPTRIPLILEEKLAFFVGATIGNGHLKKSKKQISFELTNFLLIKNLEEIIFAIFNRHYNIHKRKERIGQKVSYVLGINNNSIYLLLNKFFKIPTGKKSNIVFIPKIILSSKKSIQSAFLIGILVTEGGKRKRGLGLSTSSKKLWIDLIKLFNNLNIEVLKDKWIYKKYNKEYYGLSFKKTKLQEILNLCKDKDINRVLLDCENLKV